MKRVLVGMALLLCSAAPDCPFCGKASAPPQQGSIEVWDEYAKAALTGLAGMSGSNTTSALASRAASLADQMMAERAKRMSK